MLSGGIFCNFSFAKTENPKMVPHPRATTQNICNFFSYLSFKTTVSDWNFCSTMHHMSGKSLQTKMLPVLIPTPWSGILMPHWHLKASTEMAFCKNKIYGRRGSRELMLCWYACRSSARHDSIIIQIFFLSFSRFFPFCSVGIRKTSYVFRLQNKHTSTYDYWQEP